VKKFSLILLTIFLSFPLIVWSQTNHRMGAIPTPPEIAKKYLKVLPGILVRPVQLPSSKDFSDKLPPIGNQGDQGSCVAWATAYYKSFQEGKEHGWDFSDNSQIASPAFIFNQIVLIKPEWFFGTKEEGSYLFDAFLLLAREGCCSLTDMPYNENNYSTLPTKNQLKNAINWKADSFSFFFYQNNYHEGNQIGKRKQPLLDKDIEDLKIHLANGDIFVMTIPVYLDGFRLTGMRNNNYFYDGPSSETTFKGVHAICICGYYDDLGNGKGGFKLRNSWGTEWGNNGDAYISYNFVKNYAIEAVSMVDKENYSWSKIIDFDILDIYRADLIIDIKSITDDEWKAIMGGYKFQRPEGLARKDKRKGLEMIFDVSDMNPYILNVQDMWENGNTGTITSFKLENVDGNVIAISKDTPKSIPDDGGSTSVKLSFIADIVLITSPLQLLQSPLYYVGDTITSTFTISNQSPASVTFQTLTVGGRGPGGDTDVQDFTHRKDIILDSGESYSYQGNLTLTQSGNYHFFCAYQTQDGQWNTCVDLGPGLTDDDRKEDIIVFELEEFPGENATNLSDYYSAWSKNLPSLNERAKIYECLGLGSASSYTGSSQQNTQLLNAFKQRQMCPSKVDELECEDTNSPTITAKIPASNTTNVPINTNIQITFSEPMNQSATEGVFSITPNVAGSKSWQDNTFIFNPTVDLEYQKTYQIVIDSSATDLAGNSLEQTEWSFTTIKQETNCFEADLDCNGKIDIADVRIIASYWNTQQGDARYNSNYDLNEDGKINLLDVRKVAQYWGESSPFTSSAAPSVFDISSIGINAKKALIKVTPSNQEITVGKTSTISIEIGDVVNLGAVEFTLRYNPSIIEIQTDSIEIGDFVSKKRLLPLGPKFKDVDGLKELIYGLSLLGNEPGPSGNGTLVQIKVKAIDSGNTALNLKNVQIVDASLQLKPISVEIKDSSITVLPEVIAGIEGFENTRATIQTNNTLKILPVRNKLFQNYPNPFNPETWIPYQLAKPAQVTIRIYDIKGQLIRNLYLGYKRAGSYINKDRAAYWNGKNEFGEKAPNGMYFYSIKADNFTATRKMLLIE